MQMRKMAVLVAAAISLGAIDLLGNAAHASLIASDSFSYNTSETLGAQSGAGNGWGGGWMDNITLTTAATEPVQANSLTTPPNYLTTATGGSAGGAANAGMVIYRALASSISLDVDQDIYFSILTRRSVGTQGRSMGIAFHEGSSAAKASFGNSTGGNAYVTSIGALQQTASSVIANNPTYLWVFKISAKATGNDQLFVQTYRSDPSPHTVPNTEPATWQVEGQPAVATGSLTQLSIAMGTGAQLEIDEIRLGTTWQDVAAVPEPASVGAVGGLVGLALLRRRR